MRNGTWGIRSPPQSAWHKLRDAPTSETELLVLHFQVSREDFTYSGLEIVFKLMKTMRAQTMHHVRVMEPHMGR